MTDRVLQPALPHSLDAERTLLGALLLEPDRAIEVAAVVRAEDFYDPVHRSVYATIRRLAEMRRVADYVTVAEELKADEAIERLGGPAFLMELCNAAPTASHATHYAEIVRDKALHRQLAGAAFRMQQWAVDESVPAAEGLELAEQALLAVSRHAAGVKPQHIADAGAESYERYARLYADKDSGALAGLATGFLALNQMLTGLQPGSFTVIAARPSVG